MTMDLAERLAHARQAEALLAHPLLVRGFCDLERRCIESWIASPEADTGLRERLWHQIRALTALKALLRQAVTDGRLAQGEIASKQQP